MILFSDLSRLCNYLSSASPFNPLSTFGSERILCLTLNSKINYRVREYCSSNDRVLIYIETEAYLYCPLPMSLPCSPSLSQSSCKCRRDSSTICRTASGSRPSPAAPESPGRSCRAKESL